MFYTLQLEWVKAVQQIRSPFFDTFFKFFDFFDRQEFVFILIPAIWLGYHWKAGLRLFYILLLSGLVNYALKHFFACPRPFHLDPSLAVIYVNGYGFPSGAAQTAVLLPGLLLNYYRNKWTWIVALNFFFGVSLSRVYLGVHFPLDVVTGWGVGAALWAFFTHVRPPLENYLRTLQPQTLFWLSQLIPLSLFYFWQSNVLRFCTSAMGVGMGVFVCSQLRLFLAPAKNRFQMVYRTAVGSGGLFALYALLTLLPIPFPRLHLGLSSYLLGLWLSLGATWLLRSAR